MNVKFPFAFDSTGRTAQRTLPDHVNDMIELILFTAPGERVNLPPSVAECATRLRGNSDVLAAAQQQAIQARPDQWLSDLIQVNAVTVAAEDSTLLSVIYTLVATQQQSQQFLYGGPSQ